MAEAGIDGINISLDTLDDEEHFRITRIEMMPIGLGKEWKCLPEDEMRKMLESRYGGADRF